MEGAVVETKDIPGVTLEAKSQRPPVDKVAKIIENLAVTYAASESPNKQTEIDTRTAALRRMGVDSSWYSGVEHGEPQWVNKFRKAKKMSDGGDPDFGKYPKARKKSRIREAIRTVDLIVDFTKPITDERNQSALNSLAVAVETFVGRKELSDLKARAINRIITDIFS